MPPIRSAASPAGKASSPPTLSTSNIDGDIYIADGDYIKDIEVNDLRNRYTLTKGSTQKMVNQPLATDPLRSLRSMKLTESSTLCKMLRGNC